MSLLNWLTGQVSSVSFPYTIGNPVNSYLGKSIWTLHSGTKKDDGSPVSIFCFDAKKNPSKLEVAKNGFKKAKTTRHPNFLTYLDGVEMESNIYIVTEPIQPLDDVIEDIKKFDNAISWGIYQITKGLSFLNNDHHLTHGNINMTTVFVTKAGDWKLGALDLVTNLKEITYSVLKNHNDLIPSKYKPPEMQKSLWSNMTEYPSFSIDSWMLGCLLYECYNGPMSKSEDVKDLSNIPKQLQQSYQKCFSSNPESRLNPSKFLECPYFQNIFVETCVFLENITLKDNFEKEAFYKKLDQHIEKLPGNICKFKIIPHLITAFDFGPVNLRILGIILKISSNLTPEEYSQKIIPSVLKWFASDDRALRINLLENLEHYIQHLTPDLINNQIFGHIVHGFNDNPTLKELTIKSMLLFAPKLSEKTFAQLLKYFAALQKDPLPGIRTNTTICLGRICDYLTEDTKKKVLIPAFSTALKDNFVPHQNAGINAFLYTINNYSADQIAGRVIPELSQCLVNPERSIRTAAFKAVHQFLGKVEKMVENMESPPHNAANHDASIPSNPQQSQAQGSGDLFGWAMNYTKKLVNSGETPPPPSSNRSTPLNTSSLPSTPSSNYKPVVAISSTSSTPPTAASSQTKSITSSTGSFTTSNNGWDDDLNDEEFNTPPTSSKNNKPTSTSSSTSSFSKSTSKYIPSDDEDEEEEDNKYSAKKQREDLPKMPIKPTSTASSSNVSSSSVKGKGMQIVSKKPAIVKFEEASGDGWDLDLDLDSSAKPTTKSSVAAKKTTTKLDQNNWEAWD